MQYDSKSKLIISTIRSINSMGLHGITTAKIAKKAGLSEAMIYKLFKNKNELIGESYLYIKEELNKYVSSVELKSEDFLENCFKIWEGHLNYFLINPSHLSVINQVEHSKYFNEIINKRCIELNEFTTSFYDLGVKSGLFIVMDIEIVKALFFAPILSIAESINANRIDDSSITLKEIFNRAIKCLLK